MTATQRIPRATFAVINDPVQAFKQLKEPIINILKYTYRNDDNLDHSVTVDHTLHLNQTK